MTRNGNAYPAPETYPWYPGRKRPLAEESEAWLAAQVNGYFSLHNAVHSMVGATAGKRRLKSVRLAEARQPEGWCLVTLVATEKKVDYVAHHVGPDPAHALLSAIMRFSRESLRWKECTPFDSRTSPSDGLDAVPQLPAPPEAGGL